MVDCKSSKGSFLVGEDSAARTGCEEGSLGQISFLAREEEPLTRDCVSHGSGREPYKAAEVELKEGHEDDINSEGGGQDSSEAQSSDESERAHQAVTSATRDLYHVYPPPSLEWVFVSDQGHEGGLDSEAEWL